MTLSSLATILASLAGIISGLVWLIKQFKSSKTEADQGVDKKIEQERDQVSKGGRPKWD